jgi:lipopolysaccharide cholinephosphotransferase
VDVGLLRPDYERFLRVAPHELENRYFLQTTESDPGYFQCFAKIRVSGTRFVEATSIDCDIHEVREGVLHEQQRYRQRVVLATA